MAHVLLGQSYYLRFDPKLWEAMQPYPPLGTLYAAAILRARGHDVALFDAMLTEGPAEWASALARHTPRYAVLFEDNFNYLSKMSLLRMRQAAFEMIRMARAAGCRVIAAGADMTDHPELYLAEGAHVVLIGEGDETLPDVIDALERDVPLNDVRGIAYLGADAMFSNTGSSGSFRLVGWDAEIAGDMLTLHLNWQGVEPSRQPIWFAGLLVSAENAVVPLAPWQPGGASPYPTTCWSPGTVIGDTLSVKLDQPLTGEWLLSLAAYGNPAQPEGRLSVRLAAGDDTQIGLGPIQ